MKVWLVIEHQLGEGSYIMAARWTEAAAVAEKAKLDERNSRRRFSHHFSVEVEEHTVDDPDDP